MSTKTDVDGVRGNSIPVESFMLGRQGGYDSTISFYVCNTAEAA